MCGLDYVKGGKNNKVVEGKVFQRVWDTPNAMLKQSLFVICSPMVSNASLASHIYYLSPGFNIYINNYDLIWMLNEEVLDIFSVRRSPVLSTSIIIPRPRYHHFTPGWLQVFKLVTHCQPRLGCCACICHPGTSVILLKRKLIMLFP